MAEMKEHLPVAYSAVHSVDSSVVLTAGKLERIQVEQKVVKRVAKRALTTVVL
jgi:hypothetical protein